ncbi:BACON domain-containing protein [uncultured Alistipes sp.]|uniref:BACON domain-containing protein n=1 Tax=uncultured Alistipes sp. TaxID=538949 RepID=UPI0025CEBD80|nr:BACON domain-containing protein [uncultured Alistipes sp.]
MKYLHKLTIILALAGLFGMSGCSDDDKSFLKRNLREMSFSYLESSNTFTIRATGDWYISDVPDRTEWTDAAPWVHVDQLSGKGNPGVYQKITVTCDPNIGVERYSKIYLHGSGEQNVEIAITQENGVFEWKPFDNGQKFDVSGLMKLNTESEAVLRIPYIKATGTEKYTFTVTQTGGNGLSVANGEYGISAPGNGYIEIPISGTGTKQGIVTFAVKATDAGGAEKDFGLYSTIVRAGFDPEGEETPLLVQNFNKFPWGGDCIGKKAGVVPVDKTVANLSLDSPTTSITSGTNASIGGITSTVRNGNAVFYRAIGMEGWTGYLNYMCPGYMQFGSAGDNNDGQPGNIISPILDIPTGYDMLLTCKVAIWAAAPDQGMVGICEKNDGFWIARGTLSKINTATKRYFTLDIPTYTWIDVAVVIPNPGAQVNPAFFVSTADSWFDGSKVKAGRWYIDDIKLVY